MQENRKEMNIFQKLKLFRQEQNEHVRKVHLTFSTLILLLSAILFFFAFYNITSYPRYLIIIFLSFILIIYPKAKQQETEKTEEEINLFDDIVTKPKPDNSNLFMMLFFSLYGMIIVIYFILKVVNFFPLKLYYDLDKSKVSLNNDISVFAHLGDYMGGTVGTILTFFAFIATLVMLYQQQKQINTTENSIKQQQFEKTFFNLSEKLKECANNKNMHQFYVLLKIIFREIYQNLNGNKIYTQKYIDILKTYLTNDILTKILDDELFKQNYYKTDTLHFNIKNIIEKYSLFQYLEIELIMAPGNQPAYNKRKILRFKISAYEKNHKIMPIRISLEENPDELKEYSKHSDKKVRQAVAENKNTPIEILEQLSEDREEEVRQAAINTINSLKSQNDENN